jgi:hypothetical protein
MPEKQKGRVLNARLGGGDDGALPGSRCGLSLSLQPRAFGQTGHSAQIEDQRLAGPGIGFTSQPLSW